MIKTITILIFFLGKISKGVSVIQAPNMGLFCLLLIIIFTWAINKKNSKHFRWAICPFFVSRVRPHLIFCGETRLAKFEQKLTEMLRPAVEEVGKELLGVEFISAGNNSVLRLFIDHENGIEVDDCAEVSRQVGAILDVEDPISSEYNLEVSSPGLDRPLFDLSQFEAVIGETINVKVSMPLNGRRKFKGKLDAIENDTLIVIVDGQDYELVFSNIDKANLVYNFNK